jgi:hypothetical protein
MRGVRAIPEVALGTWLNVRESDEGKLISGNAGRISLQYLFTV